MKGMRAKSYTVSDGHLMLVLTPAKEGGYVVTSPIDPELVTQAETVPEAFAMARDALRGLHAAMSPVPRHALIKSGTVRGICRLLGIPRP